MIEPEYRVDVPSLVGPRLKLERAEQHLDELEPLIRAYVESDPYVVSDETQRDGDWNVLTMGDVRSFPDPRWGVRVGEFFHDLRSALDNLVWQLIALNGQQANDRNQFPVFTEPPGPARRAFARKLKNATRFDEMVWGVHRDHVAIIRELQPYLGLHIHRGQKVALAGVATMNNIDKHKILHPALGFTEKGEVGSVERVEGLRPDQIEIVYRLGSIYPGAELLRWRVIGSDAEVEMQGEIPYDIAFGHANTTLDHLDWVRERIGEVIERFALAFPADPAKP